LDHALSEARRERMLYLTNVQRRRRNPGVPRRPGVARPFWQTALETCEALVQKMNAAGGDAETMHLPKMGIEGNSHILMQDKNSLALADLIIAWIDEHVDRG
jgi:hypothetical protein